MATRVPSTITIGVLWLLTFAAAAPGQVIWYVDDDAPEPGDGQTWATAFSYLQDALAVAAPGDEIHVAQGAYKPDQGAGHLSGDRDASFRLISGAVIKGGYAGLTHPDPDARDPVAYETILSGDLEENDGPDFANNDENSRCVVFAFQTDTTTVLDGFTVTGGSGGCSVGPSGGGISIVSDSRLMVLDCLITGNAAEQGGGVSCNWSAPTFARCTITGNAARTGGGLLVTAFSEPTFTDCVIADNTTVWWDGVNAGRGGGLVAFASTISLDNCRVSGNVAYGGGGFWVQNTNLTLTGCTVSGNVVEAGGAGILGSGGPLAGLTMTNCTITDNIAAGTGGGGVYWGYDSTPITISNSIIARNEGAHGGGVFLYRSSAHLINCPIAGNQAYGYGGGIFIEDSDMLYSYRLTNCAITGNSALEGGGGIATWEHDLDLIVMNSTFAGNIAGDERGGAVHNLSGAIINSILWNNSPDEVSYWNGYDPPEIAHSNVQGGWEGEGNIAADPLFADLDGPDNTMGTADDDLRLSPGSPCINAGSNDAPALPETDLDGHARILCGQVDMGAYEFGIGDYDCDGTVDVIDFANWSACMTGPVGGPYLEGCESFDFDHDADVDLQDFGAFQATFDH